MPTLETTLLSSPTLLSNPLSIQHVVLTDYQERLENDKVLVDPNNSFAFLLEACSRVTATATVANDAKLNGLYPIRANTISDLYNHLSDYDYLGFFSYPATLNLKMMLSRDFLIQNAVAVPGTNYQMVVIPADTVFTIGRFSLGLYYPIQIKINASINSITASYDVSVVNPLKSLATDTLTVLNSTYEGVDLISIEFECYQFNKQVITETVNPDMGFIKTYPYTDLFYAVRVFDVSSGSKVELAYTLSDSVYDVNKPTMNLKIMTDTNKLTLSLPQIYFTAGKVGRQLLIELYTTQGELDVSLSNLQLSDISANFAMSSPNTDLTYTSILKLIPAIIITPATVRMTGGSNCQTFPSMKDTVVYHNNSANVPITRMDLNRFFTKNGFTYAPKIDNLTDRRLYAYKKVYDGIDEIAVTCGGFTINIAQADINSSIIYQNNGTIVILPTAIYQYLSKVNKFSIVDDATSATIKNAAGLTLVNILNNGNYFSNPHHIVIKTLDRYPVCDMYDLLTTETRNVSFIDENQYLSSQMSLVTVDIRHLNSGAGSYSIRAGIKRTSDISSVAIDQLLCQLTVISDDGVRIGISGSYVGTFGELDYFDFAIATSYKITNTAISVTNLNALTLSPLEYMIRLTGTMYLSTFIKQSTFPNISNDINILNQLTTDDGSWLGVSLQSFNYVLGTCLSDVLDPNLITNWTSDTYQKYPADVPQLYEHDVYLTNPDGTLAFVVDPIAHTITTTKLHAINDPVLDSHGAQVIRHRAGDTMVDAGGNPITVLPGILDFTIDLSAYSYSRQVVTNDFLINLSQSLNAYYQTIRNMGSSILENTEVYFRPIITAGIGNYKVNNNTIIQGPLELSFVFNVYVSQATHDDNNMETALTDKIVAIVQSHLDDPIISLNTIAADIGSTLGAYINSVDAVSINGSSAIQTMMNIDINSSPKLGRSLIVGVDNQLTYTPNVLANFKALDK